MVLQYIINMFKYFHAQVEVMVNYIPAICASGASCDFVYDLEFTPHVSSVTPALGKLFPNKPLRKLGICQRSQKIIVISGAAIVRKNW